MVALDYSASIWDSMRSSLILGYDPSESLLTYEYIICLSLLQSGLVGGLETLCGQAYGAQEYQKLGFYTQSAIISLNLVSFLISISWIFMDKFLVLIGQEPQISQEARKYSVWLIPALFGCSILKPIVRFLQTQSLTLPMLYSSFLVLCFHVPLCWILVYKLEMGIVGAAVAFDLSTWLNVLLLGFYVMFSSACEKTRPRLSTHSFLGIREFSKLAVPSAVMVWYVLLLVTKYWRSNCDSFFPFRDI